jgi:hypothetical protein
MGVVCIEPVPANDPPLENEKLSLRATQNRPIHDMETRPVPER